MGKNFKEDEEMSSWESSP